MKAIITAIVCALLLGCGDNKNELMTKLINDKRAMEDSLLNYQYMENNFMKKAKTSIKDPDTSLWHRFADSSTAYYMAGHNAKNKLDRIDFSIDSLSKMK
jgi:hypothetical protein